MIGAPKAGTTSLDFYLGLHPEIQMARPKEPGFFADVPPPAGRWSFGVDWYRELFAGPEGICGDCSTIYAASPSVPSVPQRMAEFVPHVKIIYLLRQPYERLQSHFLMDVRSGAFEGSFADYISAAPVSLDSSCYGRQHARYLEFFPPENILLIETEKLRNDTQTTLSRIFRHIGADDQFHSPLFRMRLHVGAKTRFPSRLGRRILAGKTLRIAKNVLPAAVFHHLRNLVLLPFCEPPSSIDLPTREEETLKSMLREEVSSLRNRSGLELPSLEIR